ncbi:MAG: response regulator [Desulfatiglandaceae bacterium]
MALDLESPEEWTILIAEDDPDDRLILQAAFDAGGFSTHLRFVRDGEELMNFLNTDEPVEKRLSRYVLVLDLNMPKKDGRRALWEIRQNPTLRHLPVVVLTTSSAEQDLEYCTKLGISDYVTKPNNFDELIEFVKSINQLCQMT